MTTLPAAPSSPLLAPCLFFSGFEKKKGRRKRKRKKESFYQRVKARTSSPPLAILSSNFAASRVSWKRIYPPKLGRNTRGHASWMYSGNDSFHQLSRFEGGGGKRVAKRRPTFRNETSLSAFETFRFVKNRVWMGHDCIVYPIFFSRIIIVHPLRFTLKRKRINKERSE